MGPNRLLEAQLKDESISDHYDLVEGRGYYKLNNHPHQLDHRWLHSKNGLPNIAIASVYCSWREMFLGSNRLLGQLVPDTEFVSHSLLR